MRKGLQQALFLSTFVLGLGVTGCGGESAADDSVAPQVGALATQPVQGMEASSPVGGDGFQRSMTPKQRHCIAAALATKEGLGTESADVSGRGPADVSPEPVQCFDSFAEAIRFATKNTVRLPSEATVSDLTQAQLNASPVYVLAVEYQHGGFGGSSMTYTSGVSCWDGYSFFTGSMPSGWDNIISSARAYSGCNHSIHFEHPNYGGASTDCYGECSYIGDAMNDRTSSIRWFR